MREEVKKGGVKKRSGIRARNERKCVFLLLLLFPSFCLLGKEGYGERGGGEREERDDRKEQRRNEEWVEEKRWRKQEKERVWKK